MKRINAAVHFLSDVCNTDTIGIFLLDVRNRDIIETCWFMWTLKPA